MDDRSPYIIETSNKDLTINKVFFSVLVVFVIAIVITGIVLLILYLVEPKRFGFVVNPGGSGPVVITKPLASRLR